MSSNGNPVLGLFLASSACRLVHSVEVLPIIKKLRALFEAPLLALRVEEKSEGILEGTISMVNHVIER